ncbi:MAG: hypothetical protein LUQ65_00090 [Candidatus Helarchaeota archaeon]|nr:hypothetical protein [Candidatus Helarchaeota archaeon]
MTTKLEPEKLNPEVKWRTMVGLFLNYLSTVHRVLKKEVDEKAHRKITETIGLDFWREQAQAFINIFNLNPGSAIDISFLERILASLLDIKLKIISENSEEVLMECEYRFCPIRIGMRATLGDYCNYCGLLMQYMTAQIDPTFKYEMIKMENCFQHKISRSK